MFVTYTFWDVLVVGNTFCEALEVNVRLSYCFSEDTFIQFLTYHHRTAGMYVGIPLTCYLELS